MAVAPPHGPLTIETVTPETIIARLQRDLHADPRQQAIAPARLEATITQTVQGLWDQSRVKTFIPVLALRETRARLARGHDADGVTAPATPPLPADDARAVD